MSEWVQVDGWMGKQGGGRYEKISYKMNIGDINPKKN